VNHQKSGCIVVANYGNKFSFRGKYKKSLAQKLGEVVGIKITWRKIREMGVNKNHVKLLGTWKKRKSGKGKRRRERRRGRERRSEKREGGDNLKEGCNVLVLEYVVIY